MRAVRKVLAFIYLVAGIVALGIAAAQLAGARVPGIESALRVPGVRIACLVCAGIALAGVVVTAFAALFERPAPACMRPEGNPDIEVTLAALESVARRSAPGDDDVLIESVEGRISGRDRDQVRLTVEAIAFTHEGLAETAARMQARVQEACERMLGTSGVRVRVRFLPSKTTIVTKEV